MFKRLPLALVLGCLGTSAWAQTCPTRPVGDNSNACASTAFVQANSGASLPSALITQFYIGTGAAGSAGVGSTGTHLAISGGVLGVDATGTGVLATQGDIATSLPSTSNLYKGSGTAGSASAATPGTDYITPAEQTSAIGLALPSATTAQLYGGSGAAGAATQVTVGSGLTLSGETLTASSSTVVNNITGNLPSNFAGTSTTATLSISAGLASDSTTSAELIGAGYSWAVANGNAINGYQGGTTLPNSTTIHFFLCNGGSGTGSFASTSLTPTCPTGYAVRYRRIFSFLTNSSGTPIPYVAIEVQGGSLLAYLATQTEDIASNPGTSSRTLYTLNVPQGVRVAPLVRAQSLAASASFILTSPDETDVAPPSNGASTVPLADVTTAGSGFSGTTYTGQLTTNTSGQIGVRGSTTLSFYLTTRGWIDFRRN